MPSSLAPAELRVETHPVGSRVLGIGESSPRLSWTVPSADQGWAQSAYEIEHERGGVTTSRVVESTEQLFVPWSAPALAARELVDVRVRVRGESWSPWSLPVTIEAGLLDPADWLGGFMSPVDVGAVGDPAPLLRGTWTVPGPVVSARLYATAQGLYDAQLNGSPVGDELLTPGWTSYHDRLRYQTFDVTDLIHEGRNDATVLLGNGWWRGQLTWDLTRCTYGDRLALLAQLEVVTADGRRHVLAADETWTAEDSGILLDDLYDGQTTELGERSSVRSGPVETVSANLATLVAPDGPPVRITEVVQATQVWRSPAGKLLVDFGQNVVGWVRLSVEGQPRGHVVTVRHAEVLEEKELGTRPLRQAKATDSYHLAGVGREVLEPRFTFHGFRYAEVEGLDELPPGDIHAVVVGTDLPRTGWFESSDELLNRLHENVVWGMRGNFVDVPTDCPQRDERLGWTGDIQVFGPTAQFLFDSTGFLRSWLQDLSADQQPDGAVPFVVPDVLRNGLSSAAWGDAAVVLPWVLYERSGDAQVLARQLPSMQAWVDHVAAKAGPDGVCVGGFQFGDWLDPTAPPEDALKAKADADVVATAYLVRSAELLGKAAEVVGAHEVAEHARAIFLRSRAGFRREFVTPGGRVISDAQTVYALALQFDLLDGPTERRGAADRLADLVRTTGFRIGTGFVGTPIITDALADNGHLATAYRLLMQTDCPSWLYSVTMGATTIWERWDSMLPDGTINPGQMTSFNHYALGSVADWLHRTVAGLAPAAPGYRRLWIAPRPGGGLTHALARHLTPYGEASVQWSVENAGLVVEATVPVGTTATVELPGQEPVEVAHGSHRWTVPIVARPAPTHRTVRELMDDEPAWQRFSAAVISHRIGGLGPHSDAATVAERLIPGLDLSPVAALSLMTMGNPEPSIQALTEELPDLLGPGSRPAP